MSGEARWKTTYTEDWFPRRTIRDDQIKQIAILVNKSVSLPSAPCDFEQSQGISLVVFGLIGTPMSELVLVLHEHFHLGNGR